MKNRNAPNQPRPPFHRLLWDQIAPWHQLRNIFETLKKLDANIVYGTHTSCIGNIEGGFDLYEYEKNVDPLTYLARIQNFSVCPYGLNLRFKAMSQIIERIGIDGIIFASNKSCKPYSIMQMDLKERITWKFDIPSILIDVDHADARAYNESMFFKNIEMLIEVIR